MADPWAKREGRDVQEKLDKEREEEEKKKKKGKDDKGIWETDAKKREIGYMRHFKYGNISKDIIFDGNLEKEGNSWKSWKRRYFCIHYNYLIYYDPGNNFSPQRTEEPKGFINLYMVTDPNEIKFVPEKTTYMREFLFQLPTAERIYYMSAGEQNQMKEWIDELKKQVSLLKENNIAPNELFDLKKKFEDLQKAIPREGIRDIPNQVDPKDASGYINTMRSKYEEKRKYLPLVNKLKMYAEFRQGLNKLYIDWFIGSDGLEKLMSASEEAVLGKWPQFIEQTGKKLEYVYEERYFQEDMNDMIDSIQQSLQLIDCYNDYNEKVLLKTGNPFDELTQRLKKTIPDLKSFPSRNDINFNNYDNGTIKATAYPSTWTFNKQNGTLNCDSGEFNDVFSITGGILTTMKYGSVLWNNRMWIWGHPNIPFTLRFSWNSSTNVFSFVPSKKPNLPVMASIVLQNWKFDKRSGVMSSIEGEGAPIIPMTSWAFSGNIPPPVILTVAIIPQIRNIVTGMLGFVDL
eukprot:TRINITY_DN1771_c0_g1_i2.p1 TRINITY_DN1771_c0_g1~~TRINITY_DN1771_c0_g1_i2.p1  ORF type:complete len:516 (+),score=109.29 TRINITY_DN1771_c0_g1_i2:71-1618(+)